MPSSPNSYDPGIICFQHCISKVFCFNLPNLCPVCNSKYDEKTLKLLPFRLPYPFVRASQYPCSIVLRPTSGDFLNDYNNSTDLHIAVTTSKGIIVEFDRNGLQRHSTNNKCNTIISGNNTADVCSQVENCNNSLFTSSSTLSTTSSSSSSSSSSLSSSTTITSALISSSHWSQCLLVESIPEPWHDIWDSVLSQVCKQSHWSVKHYNEETYNCYTFVLTFLQALCYEKLSQAAQSKTAFCEKYIVPRTTTAGKYISLYRKIRDHKLYIHPIKEIRNDNTSVNANGVKIGGNGTETGPNNAGGGNLISKLFTIKE